MIRQLSRSITLLAASAQLMPLAAGAQTKSGAEKALIQLQQEWADARKHADMAFLERFYAKEFTVGSMYGTESSRAEDLSMFSSGDLKPAVITDSEMVAHVYGQAALVTGVEHLEGSYRGNTGKFDLRFANTFVYRDGRWQLVRHQATPISAR